MEEKNKIEENENLEKVEMEDLKDLLEKNLECTRETQRMVKKIRRQMLWQRIMGIIYLILILAPIILAIIYLPPYLKQFLSSYGQFLPTGDQKGILEQLGNFEGIDLKSILPK
jgi:uncharacterized membrane protein YukC